MPLEARLAALNRDQLVALVGRLGDDWRASSRAQYQLFPIAAMAEDYRSQAPRFPK